MPESVPKTTVKSFKAHSLTDMAAVWVTGCYRLLGLTSAVAHELLLNSRGTCNPAVCIRGQCSSGGYRKKRIHGRVGPSPSSGAAVASRRRSAPGPRLGRRRQRCPEFTPMPTGAPMAMPRLLPKTMARLAHFVLRGRTGVLEGLRNHERDCIGGLDHQGLSGARV